MSKKKDEKLKNYFVLGLTKLWPQKLPENLIFHDALL